MISSHDELQQYKNITLKTVLKGQGKQVPDTSLWGGNSTVPSTGEKYNKHFIV